MSQRAAFSGEEVDRNILLSDTIFHPFSTRKNKIYNANFFKSNPNNTGFHSEYFDISKLKR